MRRRYKDKELCYHGQKTDRECYGGKYMSRAKKGTLVLILTAIMVMLSVFTLVFGMSATRVNAENDVIDGVTSEVSDAETLKAIRTNGNVGEAYDPVVLYDETDSAPLSSVSDIQSFLLGNLPVRKAAKNANGDFQKDGSGNYIFGEAQAGTVARVGYLVQNVSGYSWSGSFTKEFMASNLVFDGAGKTITLNPTSFNASPWVSIDSFTHKLANTFFTTIYTHSDADLNGAFIGFIPDSSEIKNTNFRYISNIDNSSDPQKTNGSGCGGVIAAYSNGKIDNCSVTMAQGSKLKMYKTSAIVTGGVNDSELSISRHSYAMGGFVGAMSRSTASISNSEIILESSSEIFVDSNALYIRDFAGKWDLGGHARAFVGGVVGWMANGSRVYNMCVSGSGSVNAKVAGVKESTGMALCGAIAGSNVTTVSGNAVNSVAGNASSCGVIDGVITTWTGTSTYNMLSSDSMKQYSPWNTLNTDNIQGQLVGIAGSQGSVSTESVKNIYCIGDKYSDSNNSYSIGYFYALDGNTKGSKMSTVVNMLYLTDENSETQVASPEKAKLTWGGTSIGSDVYAVYNIENDTKYVLWAKSVKRGSDPSSRETYFWKSDSIQDAQKYDITYTPVYRGKGVTVDIIYEFGRAVYMYKVFADGNEAAGANLNRDAVSYGTSLEIPEIRLFTMPGITDKNDPSFVRAFTEHSYWKTIKNNNNNLIGADGTKDVGSYETLIYLDGADYTTIHFLNERFRLVSYIKDDTNYTDYARDYKNETGMDYSPVDLTGKKNFDWQPRIKQTVEPKEVGVSIDHPITLVVSGVKPNLSTEYTGEVIEFTGTALGVINNDDVKVTIQYFKSDDLDTPISGIYNAGDYVIKATALSNANYTISAAQQDINLRVEKRGAIIQFASNVSYTVENGEYHIVLPYSGLEQYLNYDKAYSIMSDKDMIDKGLHFLVYNVRNVDISIIQLEHIAFDENTAFDNINVGKFRAVVNFSDGGAAENYDLPDINTFVIEIEPVDVTFEAWDKKVFYYGDEIPETEERDGDYAYALSPTNQRLAISEKKYERKNEEGEYEGYASSPVNVGEYRLTYTFKNENNKNFNETTAFFEVEIRQRDVTFSPRFWNYSPSKYGTNNPKLGSGTFDRFFTNGSDVNTGLSVTHYREHKVEYRYQYIGQPQSEDNPEVPKYDQIKDMDVLNDPTDYNLTHEQKIYKELKEVGCYIIYPVLLLKNGDAYEYKPEAMANYNFTLGTAIVNIEPLPISIVVRDDFTKGYGADVPEFDGRANISESSRAWRYADGSEHFYGDDDIEVVLKTTASKYSSVNDQYDVTVDYFTSSRDQYDSENNKIFDCVERNYDVSVVTGKLTVTRLKVEVVTDLSAEEIIYGEEPPRGSFTVLSANTFYDTDNMTAEYISDADEKSGVGRYEVRATFEHNAAFDNYDITVLPNYYIVRAKNIVITDMQIVGGKDTFDYDGEIHNPEAIVNFDGVVSGDELGVSYDFYKDGEIVNEPVDAGTYTAKVSGIVDKATGEVNRNYVLVKAPGQDDYPEASITIEKRVVEVQARNAYRVWHVPGSLAPIEGDFVKESDGTYKYTILPQGEAHFTYIGTDKFVERDGVEAVVTINNIYYDDLGLQEDAVVDLQFTGKNLEKNYKINVRKGKLLVIEASLEQIRPFVKLVYGSGESAVDYVDGIMVYNGTNLYNKISVFTSTEAIRNMLIFNISSDEEGDNIVDNIVNAGTYYMVITPNAANGSPFNGKLTVPFKVSPAKRVLTQDSFKSKIHYNKLVFSSDIEGLEYKINGQAWIAANKDNVFEYNQVSPLQNYQIIVRAKASADGNYLESNELTVYCTTGIDASVVVNRINTITSIDFTNVSLYKALKAQIENVHPDDRYLIDQRKVAELDRLYAKLLSDASNVISGAQKVASKAAGKSGNATAAALSLSFSGVGLVAAGAMFMVSKKKREEQAQSKTVRRNRMIKVIAITIVALTVCAVVLAGCDKVSFEQEELLKLASFETPSNEKSKDLKINVTSGGMTIYSYDNGKVATNDDVDAPEFSLGADGAGFDFKEEYFKNISYLTSKSTATFTADVADVSAFLGIPDATNAKVVVVADAQNKRLNSITVVYEVGIFKVTVISTMKY